LLPALISVALLAAATARADEADELYKRLEQRWYITEVIAFHDANTMSNSDEQILLDNIERETELLLDEDSQQPEQSPDVPALSEAEQRQAQFNAEHPNPAGSKDSVRSAQSNDDIEFSTIGSDVGYALFEQNTLSADEVISYNLQAYEEVLRALDRRWLNSNYLSMTDQAKRVSRGRGRSLLFHGAWLQAVPERSAPDPVAIRSLPEHSEQDRNPRARAGERGDPADDTPELAGEIAVTVGKYLHVDANLAYYPTGQAIPNARPNAVRFGRQFNPAATNPAATQTNRFAQQPPPADASSRTQPVVELSSSRQSSAFNPGTPSDQTAAIDSRSEPPRDLLSPHLRLTQSRRMRSNQVHYIDHPGLGVLVKITQVPIPTLLQDQLRVAKQGE